MKSAKLDIIATVKAGETWAGRIRGQSVEMWRKCGWVEVWISRRDGGASFRADTVTDAIQAVSA